MKKDKNYQETYFTDLLGLRLCQSDVPVHNNMTPTLAASTNDIGHMINEIGDIEFPHGHTTTHITTAPDHGHSSDLWDYFMSRHFGEKHEEPELKPVRPDFVQFNDKKETITLIDNPDSCLRKRRTTVKTHKKDEYSRVRGFLWAYFLHHAGLSKTQAKKYLEKVVNQDGGLTKSDERLLGDARNYHKASKRKRLKSVKPKEA